MVRIVEICQHCRKLSEIVKIVENGQNCQKIVNIVENYQNYQKLSKLSKIVKTVKIVKIVKKNCQNCQQLSKLSKLWGRPKRSAWQLFSSFFLMTSLSLRLWIWQISIEMVYIWMILYKLIRFEEELCSWNNFSQFQDQLFVYPKENNNCQ